MRKYPYSHETSEYSKASMIDKELLRTEVFGYKGYCSDRDCSHFVMSMKEHMKTQYISGEYGGISKTQALKLIGILEEHNCKLDITFLESLDVEKKCLIAKLIVHEVINKTIPLEGSLLIWMLFWDNYDWRQQTMNHPKFLQFLSLVFKSFQYKASDSFYFSQAYLFTLLTNNKQFRNLDVGDDFYEIKVEGDKLKSPDKFLFNVLAEYRLIRGLDADVDGMNKEGLGLGGDYSVKAFHSENTSGVGHEATYGTYCLDKEGNETKLGTSGVEPLKDEQGRIISGAYGLDRSDESHYKDASGKTYVVFMDSPTGIALMRGDEPLALIGFSIRNAKELYINQIQRVSYEKNDRYGRCIGKEYMHFSEPVDREGFLYCCVEKLVRKYGIERVIIQSGENNKWTKQILTDRETWYYAKNFSKEFPSRQNDRVHLPLKIAQNIYDVFAENKGFQKDKKGDYYKDFSYGKI